MGGGRHATVTTTSVGLFDIHSIANSVMNEDVEPPHPDDEDHADTDDDELNCFLTLTTKLGEVHILEAITADTSQRIVSGIRNMAARLANQLVRGDPHALLDFYDNSQEPSEIRLTPEEAMARLSHMFLDEVAV